MYQLGTVTAIDRANRVVRAVLAGGGAIEATYFGDPPWLFAQAAFVAVGPSWHCDGAIGDRRVVLHDDFTYVGTTPNFGDTPWNKFGTGTAASDAAPPSDSQGHVRLQTPATLNTYSEINKEISTYPPTPPAALWWSGRFQPGFGATTVQHRAGLGADAAWDAAGADADRVTIEQDSNVSTTNWQLVTQAAGSLTRTDLPAATYQDMWFVADIVYVPSVWAACWIDGDGPYISTSNIPDINEELGVGARCFTRAAAFRKLYLDWQHLEVVNPIVSPFDLDLASA